MSQGANASECSCLPDCEEVVFDVHENSYPLNPEEECEAYIVEEDTSLGDVTERQLFDTEGEQFYQVAIDRKFKTSFLIWSENAFDKM